MALLSNPNPTIQVTDQWSTFYNSHAYKYSSANMEEDRNRLRTLREDWLRCLRKIPACNSDWPTTKTEVDQLMVLLRWEPSKMWKIAKEARKTTSAQDKPGNEVDHASSETHTRSDQDVQKSHSKTILPEEEEESHHVTTLRPSVFPFAYIRTFYNEMDIACMKTDELKAFAYEQSLKQIDNFYGRAAKYCKILQKALQACRNHLVASKLYDAFERDHQVLANNLNREWIVAVNNKMRELGITMSQETGDDLNGSNEATNLELTTELLEGLTETPSMIFTKSNTSITETESISQASSSSTEKPESVHPLGKSDDKLFESEAETKSHHPRPHGNSNEQRQPSPVAAHEHPPGLADHRVASPQVPKPHFSGGGLKNKVYYGTSHPGWMRKSPEDDESSLTRRNLPSDDSPPPRYDAKYSPTEGMQASTSSKQSGQRRSNSTLQAALPPREASYTGWPNVGAQLGSADIKIRNSTSLSNNEILDSQRSTVPNVMPQDVHMREPRIATGHGFYQPGTQIRDVHPGTREDHVVENHEAFRLGFGYDGMRDPPISSHPKWVPPNTSNETPARYATSPVETHYIKPGVGYGRQSESEQPSKRISATDTIRKVPSTSNSNSLPSRQQGSHGPNFPSMPGQSNESIPYVKDPMSDDQGPSTNILAEPHDKTQDIDWQAVNQKLEQFIEKLYADDARNRAKSSSQRMAGGPNHNMTNVAVDDSAEDEDASLVSTDESDLTDSDELDEEEVDIYNPMENPSNPLGVNIDRTIPYAGQSGVNIVPVMSGSSSNGRKVSWGKEFVYRIDPVALHQPNRTATQGIPPRSALKRRM